VTVLLFTAAAWGGVSPQIPLEGSEIPAFAQPLPLLAIAPQNGTMTTIVGNRAVTLRMCEFRANMLPVGTVPGYQGTWVWGYLVDESGDSSCQTLIAQYGDFTGLVDTYIGPVIVNARGSSTDIRYVNDLGDSETTNVLAYRYSTDQTLHWADPLAPWTMANHCAMAGMIPMPGDKCAENYLGPIAAVPHLHGGEVPAEIDGSPDSWFTSDGLYRGHKYYSFGAPGNEAVYKYPNVQEAAPIWFHDHTLGATRLNVYAGLAGAYFIHDPALTLPPNLQPLTEVIPLVFQDRMFDTDGQLFFQAGLAGGILWALNPEHPYWSPEFVGDTVVVNGKAWPYVNVEPRRYRFLFLNGSNARAYELFLASALTKANAPPLYVIGTDGGYLDTPVKIDRSGGKGQPQHLVIMPGERYEVIIDFGGLPPGTHLVLKNVAKTPFPGGEAASGNLGKIVEFHVVCPNGCPASDPSFDPATGAPLRSGAQTIVRLANPAAGTLADGVTPALTRQLTLNEVMGEERTEVNPITGSLTAYPGGPLEVLVNNTKWSGASPRPFGDFTPITVNGVTTAFSEMPAEGAIEVWEIVNLTADAHPIHLHLTQFQIINRQNFKASRYDEVYEEAFPTGEYQPAYGPPHDYRPANNPLSGGKYGGNPDVTPFLQGHPQPPLPNEAGWKDTVVAYPGQVTRIAVRWAPTDLPINAANLFYPFDPTGGYAFNYVWHCHIIDHEDNEMMRPSAIVPNGSAVRTLIKGVDY
jgi:FtsP/CotA-like multicopper oxidase with cupredoxin domain